MWNFIVGYLLRSHRFAAGRYLIKCDFWLLEAKLFLSFWLLPASFQQKKCIAGKSFYFSVLEVLVFCVPMSKF